MKAKVRIVEENQAYWLNWEIGLIERTRVFETMPLAKPPAHWAWRVLMFAVVLGVVGGAIYEIVSW